MKNLITFLAILFTSILAAQKTFHAESIYTLTTNYVEEMGLVGAVPANMANEFTTFILFKMKYDDDDDERLFIRVCSKPYIEDRSTDHITDYFVIEKENITYEGKKALKCKTLLHRLKPSSKTKKVKEYEIVNKIFYIIPDESLPTIMIEDEKKDSLKKYT